MSSKRVDLGVWRTPLEQADRLGAALGLNAGDLWVKRDDWLGFGGGGNKLRKLERLCAGALAEGATTLVASGAAQSNFARLTAASARRLGLDATIVLRTPEATRAGASAGNLALHGLFGADVIWTGGPLDDAARAAADDLARAGEKPAVFPLGGSSADGASGYAECAREILTDAPDVAHVVTPVGSGGTMAGLVCVLGPERVLGGHAGAIEQPRAAVAQLATELHPGAPVTADELRLDEAVMGDGYGLPTPESRRAMDLAARHEGILLDPVYGAKAAAALARAIQNGEIEPGRRTVLLLTGGLPGLLGHPLAAELGARTRGA
ncbi:MAG TPA: pyridoxal-phosphate dependent enzyme [Solirubrobacteraceae bacterium]|nr:pyridoxal-phosphate dependent enzyme [Solirubrobacteraceae bacterium]